MKSSINPKKLTALFTDAATMPWTLSKVTYNNMAQNGWGMASRIAFSLFPHTYCGLVGVGVGLLNPLLGVAAYVAMTNVFATTLAHRNAELKDKLWPNAARLNKQDSNDKPPQP